MKWSSIQATVELKQELNKLRKNKEDYEDIIRELLKPAKEIIKTQRNLPCGSEYCGRSVSHMCRYSSQKQTPNKCDKWVG